MGTVSRTIYLKKIEYIASKNELKNFHPEPFNEVIAKVLNKLNTPEKRHYPNIKLVEDGEVCHFINRSKGKKFLKFEICTYVNGYVPAQFIKKFSGKALDITNDPIIDKNGNQREVAVIANFVTIGEALAIQLPRGSGGIRELEQYLTWLIRNSGIKEYKSYPYISLIDVLTKNFTHTLKAGGGAAEIKLDMLTGGAKKDGWFSKPLQGLGDKVGKASKVSVVVSGKGGTLSDEDIIDIYENQKGDFDGITIFLKNGTVVTTGKYKVKASVEVAADKSNSNPKFSSMTDELRLFIQSQMELHQVKGEKVRLINEAGKFV